MNVPAMQARLHFRGCLGTTHGSRALVLAYSKRKGVGKESRELQQTKETAAPSVATAPVTTSAAPQAQPQVPPSSVPSSITGLASPTSSSGGGDGLFDNLLVRILGSVIAIMAVINVFYSLVFFGASNVVYIFKDQLAAITKKDFVPYSERRRLEQEVFVKLEAEQVERLKAREATGQESNDGGATPLPNTGAEQDADTSADLMSLLPSKAS